MPAWVAKVTTPDSNQVDLGVASFKTAEDGDALKILISNTAPKLWREIPEVAMLLPFSISAA